MAGPIAVVLVFREARPLLAASLASLSREPAGAHQLIAIDDGSRDDNRDESAAWLHQLAACWPALRYQPLKGPGQGFAAAANLALRCSDAPLVSFLAPGDRIRAGKLSGAIRAFQAQPQLQQLLCGRQLLDVQGQTLTEETPWLEHPTLSWSSLLLHRQVVPSCWTVRRQAALEAGGFRADQGSLAPLDLALRLAGQAATSGWQPQVLVRQRPAPPAPWRAHLQKLRQLLESHWQRLPSSHQAWAAEARLDLALEGAALAWCAGDTPAALHQLQQVADWSAMPLARRAPRLLEHLHRSSGRHGLHWDRQAVLQAPLWRQSLAVLQRP